jgi:hypothetical protein
VPVLPGLLGRRAPFGAVPVRVGLAAGRLPLDQPVLRVPVPSTIRPFALATPEGWRADLAPRPSSPATRLDGGPYSTKEPIVSSLEYFFDAMLILVCVGVVAFTVLAVKKLYQGQR